MITKAEEIAIKLSESEGVTYEHLPNSSRFKLVSETGVKWSERSTKLGNIHYHANRIYLALDFPNGTFTEADVKEQTMLPIKNKGARSTGFYIGEITEDNIFDTVRISLYKDEVNQMDFNNNPIINFVIEALGKSKN